jgi:5-methylcytosine-specific restriction endonuclease McrA
VHELASQADLCYTRGRNIVAPTVLVTPRGRTHLVRRCILDSLSPYTAHRNFIASLSPDKKYCPRCEQVLDRFTDFYANKAQPDGRASHCKACRSKMGKASYPKEKGVRTARYHEQYPQKKESYRERDKRWRAVEYNQERLRAWKRRKHQENPEPDRERATRYRLTHPEAVQANHARRRATEAQNGGSFTVEEWKAMKQFYGYTCLKCGRKEPEIALTVDHVLPLSLGGTSDIENIQTLCKSCNGSKGARHIDYRKS